MATPHVSTHIDALNHVIRDGQIYGGHRTEDVEGDFGMTARASRRCRPSSRGGC